MWKRGVGPWGAGGVVEVVVAGEAALSGCVPRVECNRHAELGESVQSDPASLW